MAGAAGEPPAAKDRLLTVGCIGVDGYRQIVVGSRGKVTGGRVVLPVAIVNSRRLSSGVAGRRRRLAFIRPGLRLIIVVRAGMQSAEVGRQRLAVKRVGGGLFAGGRLRNQRV